MKDAPTFHVPNRKSLVKSLLHHDGFKVQARGSLRRFFYARQLC